MAPKVTSTFRAHAPVGKHDRLFNFVVPRSRRWSKAQRAALEPKPIEPMAEKVARDEQDWDPWTSMSRMGYDPSQMGQDTGFSDPSQYMRLMPYMEQMEQHPEQYDDMLQAMQASNLAGSKYIDYAGEPENKNWFSRAAHSFLSPEGATFDQGRMQKQYQDTHGQVLSQISRQLVAQGVPYNIALQRAQVAADRVIGTPEQFQSNITSRVATGRDEIGGPSLGGLSAFAASMGGEMTPVGLAGMGAASMANPFSRGYWFGDQGAQQQAEGMYEGRVKSDAINDRGGYGLWNSTLGPALTTLMSGSPAKGTAQLAAGLQELSTGGTIQNKVLADQIAERRRQAQQWQHADITGGAQLNDFDHTPGAYDQAKRRFLDRNGGASAQGEDAAARWAAATQAPYRNLFTLDPLMGSSTAESSGEDSRKWHPSQWGNYVGDWLSGSNTSEPYMEQQQDSWADQPGQGRFAPHQDFMRAFRKGDYDLRNTDISSVPLTHAGAEYDKWDPRYWMGLRQGQVAGVEGEGEFRKQFDQRYGSLLDKGMLSQQDVARVGQNLGESNRQLVDWDNRKRQNWAKNQYSGNQAMGGSGFYLPPTKAAPAPAPAAPAPQPMQPPAGGVVPGAAPGVVPGAQPMQKLNRAEKWAAADPALAPPTPEAPLPTAPPSLPEYYDFQAHLRGQMAKQLAFNRLPPGSPAAAKAPWVNPEAAYGQGFWDRWHSRGPGRGAQNPLQPFGWMLSGADKQRLDPVLRQQRQQVMSGQWRPGMEIDPLVERPNMGWTNPLGRISEITGLIPGQEEQERQYSEAAAGSPQFKQLMAQMRTGRLAPKDFFALTHGVDSARYAPGLPQATQAYETAHAGTHGQQFTGLVDRLHQIADNDVPAETQQETL